MPEPAENVSECASSSATPEGIRTQSPVKKKTGGSIRLLLWVLFVISVLVVSTGLKIKKKRLFPLIFNISPEVRQEWVEKAKEDPYVNVLTPRPKQAEGGIQYDVVAKENIDEHVSSQESLIIQQYLPNDEFLENMRQLSQKSSQMAAVYEQSMARWKKQRTQSWTTVAGGLVLFVASVVMLAKTK